MSSGIYNRMKANLFNKETDYEADVIKVMLLDTNHAFSAAHNQKSEIVGNELATAGGYTAGGAALVSKAITQAATTKFDATDIAWTSATFTAFHAVLYDDTTTNDDLICSFDFSGGKEVSSGTFTIVWSASGILTLSSA